MRRMATTRSNMKLLELRRTTAPAIAIGAPAEETQAMPKPPVVDVSASDFADNLGGHGQPDEIALPWPPAISGHAAITEARLSSMPPEPVRSLASLSCRKHAGIADVVEDPACVVEAKNKSGRQARCIRHVAPNHTIYGSQPTYLDHLALARTVRKIASLGDDAFDTASIE